MPKGCPSHGTIHTSSAAPYPDTASTIASWASVGGSNAPPNTAILLAAEGSFMRSIVSSGVSQVNPHRDRRLRRGRRGFLSWAIEHVRPSISFDHGPDDEYWAAHGGRPGFGAGDAGKWAEYLKDNATFWIKLRFDF